MRQKTKIIVYRSSLAIFIATAIVLVVVYLITSNTGSIKVNIAPDSIVFVDDKPVSSKAEGNILTVTGVKAGVHDVIVAKNGFWPWRKKVRVETNRTTEIASFTFPQYPSGAIITEKDPEYYSLLNAIEEATVPTKDTKVLSKDKTTSLWVDNGTLYAEWLGDPNNVPYAFCPKSPCDLVVPVITPKAGIQQASFFRDRSDVIVIASDNIIYGLEINKDEPQNFEPIYSGGAPRFVITESGNFIVKDGETLYELAL